MNRLVLTLSLATLNLAGITAAQTPPPPPGPDAVTTRADAIARADAMFARLDANHDGTLTPDERAAMRRGGGDPRPDARMDRPVTAAEFRDRALRRFDRADANHDGCLDPAERAAARERMRERQGDAPSPATGQ